MHMWWNFPQHLIMPGLSETEQATKYAKKLIHVIKNPVPQTPFMIVESQLQAIDRLEKIFNIMQPETSYTTVVPRKVPTIAPMTGASHSTTI